MTYKIIFTKKAEKDIDKLDNSVRQQIKKFLNKLEGTEDPRAFGDKLTGNLMGCWRYRVENYRIGVEIQDDKLIVLIIAIDHRSKIYKKMDKRINE